MSLTSRITWFKRTFGAKIAQKVAGTPLSVDFITAVALQETGHTWERLIEHHGGNVDKILEGCVGDTFDTPNRSAFPKNKAELLTHPQGAQMFAIARAALGTLAEIDSTYRRVFLGNANKFCHGFGILQYDIQHMKTDPDFFLQRKWLSFDACLDNAINELMRGVRVRGFEGRRSLSNFDAATVAIVYNRGSYNSAQGLKQGHPSGGRFYGEWIFHYLEESQKVHVDFGLPGEATGGGDTPAMPRAIGPHTVNARSGLRLREGPGTAFHTVRVVDNGATVHVLGHSGADDDWAIVDLEGDGHADGAMFAAFLTPAEGAARMEAPGMFAGEDVAVEPDFHDEEEVMETEEEGVD